MQHKLIKRLTSSHGLRKRHHAESASSTDDALDMLVNGRQPEPKQAVVIPDKLLRAVNLFEVKMNETIQDMANTYNTMLLSARENGQQVPANTCYNILQSRMAGIAMLSGLRGDMIDAAQNVLKARVEVQLRIMSTKHMMMHKQNDPVTRFYIGLEKDKATYQNACLISNFVDPTICKDGVIALSNMMKAMKVSAEMQIDKP